MTYGDGGFRRGPRRDFGPREMTSIKCSECGKDAEVPFKPREGTPVYCRECFMKKKGIAPRAAPAPEKQKEKEAEEGDDDMDEDSDDDMDEEDLKE